MPEPSSPNSNGGYDIDNHTPKAANTSASASIGMERCTRTARLKRVVPRCTGARPPSGMGSVWTDRSSGGCETVLATVRSPMAGGHLGESAIDDMHRIDFEVKRHSHAAP